MPQFDGTPYTQLTAPARGDVQGVIKDISEALPENQTKYAELQDLLKYGAWASKLLAVTASGSVALADTDPAFVEIDPNGSDRDVNFPAKGNDNHGYFVHHVGSANTLTLKRSGGATITTLAAGEIKYIKPSTTHDFSALTGGAGGGDLYNYLINGGFDIADRNVTPGTLFTVADKDFGPDRWWSTRENADVQYNRNDATGESGLTSKYYGLYKKITNAGKFVVVQVIEGVNSVPLRGKEVTFQIKMKASGSKTIRMAVLELQNAGTMDAPPATLVTAFGADTTDPTFGTNVAIITAAASKSVTTSWQSFSVTVTVPSNSKNVMAAFWTDSDFAANDTLSVAEAGLFITDTIQDWKPRLITEETLLCQRFFYRWGYENSDSGTGFRMFGYGGAGVYEGQSIRHPVTMHKIPTATVNGTFGSTNITGTPSIVDLSTVSATVSFQVTSLGTFDLFSNGSDDWFSFEAEIL